MTLLDARFRTVSKNVRHISLLATTVSTNTSYVDTFCEEQQRHAPVHPPLNTGFQRIPMSTGLHEGGMDRSRPRCLTSWPTRREISDAALKRVRLMSQESQDGLLSAEAQVRGLELDCGRTIAGRAFTSPECPKRAPRLNGCKGANLSRSLRPAFSSHVGGTSTGVVL